MRKASHLKGFFGKIAPPVPVVYSESYYVRIEDRIFPTSTYRILKERLVSDGSLKDRFEVIPPGGIKEEEILAVHSAEYLKKLKKGDLSAEEKNRLGMPFALPLLDAVLSCCGGTLTASREALKKGAAVHIGGGFHHAFPERGEGFCVLNDIAISVKALQKEGLIKKALIVDCDLHQGNGTAFIFKDDPSVFTFSIHQESCYPFKKEKSDLDVGLREYTRDKEYLRHIYDNVPKIISSFKPDILMYVAGADPFEGDQLGALGLSKEGLRERDRFIISQALNFGVPIAITLGGGYSADRRDTVDISFATITECLKVFERR